MATRRNQYEPSTYLSFDGKSNSYVGLSVTNVIPDATATVSFSVWVYLGSPDTGSTDKIRVIIGNRRDAVTDGWVFKIAKRAMDKVEFTFYDQNASSQGEISNVTVSSYRWAHIGCTFDGQTTIFYVDGNVDQKSTLGSVKTISEYTGQNIRIGHRQAAGSTFETFAGKMSDLCIWNRVLTATEFLALYNIRTTPTNNLLARWIMDEGSGTTVADLIGGFNGTIVGGVTWETTALNTPRSISGTRTIAGTRTVAGTRTAA